MKPHELTYNGPTCETCRFWCKDGYAEIAAEPDEDAGHVWIAECRRFPPPISSDDAARFPTTYSDSWCGEHQPRKAEPAPYPGKLTKEQREAMRAEIEATFSEEELAESQEEFRRRLLGLPPADGTP